MNRTVNRLLTATAVATLIIPALADLNATHMTNPHWPPHARFHFGIQFFSNVALNSFALYLLRGRRNQPDNRLTVIMAALGPLLFWGMFFPALLLPGASTWPDGVVAPANFPAILKSVHPNLILAVLISATNGLALTLDARYRHRIRCADPSEDQ